MQTRHATLAVYISDLELGAARMQGEYDLLDSGHGYYQKMEYRSKFLGNGLHEVLSTETDKTDTQNLFSSVAERPKGDAEKALENK